MVAPHPFDQRTSQIGLGCGPLARRSLPCIDTEYVFVSFDRPLDVVGTVATYSVRTGNCEIILIRGPLLRLRFTRIHGECSLVSYDRPFDIVGAVAADAAPISDRQLGLGGRPAIRIVSRGSGGNELF